MHSAKQGRFQQLEQGELVLGKGGMSKGVRYLRSLRKRRIEYFFPHWELSVYLTPVTDKDGDSQISFDVIHGVL